MQSVVVFVTARCIARYSIYVLDYATKTTDRGDQRKAPDCADILSAAGGRRCFVLSERAVRRRLEDKFEDLSATRTNCDRRRRDVRSETDLRRQSTARRRDEAMIGAVLCGALSPVSPLFLHRRERSTANLNANRTRLCRRPTGNGTICEKIARHSALLLRPRVPTIK